MSRYKQPYSLYKRGKYWYYRTYTPDGRRTVAKSTGKTSKGSAKEYCDSLYLQGALAQSSITLRQYSEHFFDDDSPYVRDRTRPLAKNSISRNRSYMENQILPNLGKVKVCDINYTMLRQFRVQMLERLAPNTTIGVMGCLQTVIKTAYKDGIISQNPFDFLEPITKNLNLIDAFTLDEIKTIYHEINDEMYANMILLMAMTGMRISECIGVDSSDIKQGNGFLYIDLNRQFNRKEYKPLKGYDCRSFPIIPEVLDMVGFQFGRISVFYRVFAPIKAQFESPDRKRLCFHSLRHFFITNTISKGIPESKVNYYTGHKQKGINQVYINFKPDDLLEFLDWQREVYHYVTDTKKESHIDNATL